MTLRRGQKNTVMVTVIVIVVIAIALLLLFMSKPKYTDSYQQDYLYDQMKNLPHTVLPAVHTRPLNGKIVPLEVVGGTVPPGSVSNNMASYPLRPGYVPMGYATVPSTVYTR